VLAEFDRVLDAVAEKFRRWPSTSTPPGPTCFDRQQRAVVGDDLEPTAADDPARRPSPASTPWP
jgi:hypothetical protein